MRRSNRPESVEECAYRLHVTRIALGLSQAEICRQAKIEPSAWNNAETGDNRLGIDNANKLRARFKISLDWLFWGDMYGLPADLAKRIAEVEAAPAPRRA